MGYRKTHKIEETVEKYIIYAIKKHGLVCVHRTSPAHLKLRNKLKEMVCENLIKNSEIDGDHLIYAEVVDEKKPGW